MYIETSQACATHVHALAKDMHIFWPNVAWVVPGQLDMLYKIAAAGQSAPNVCRNLHRLIHREGVTVPVAISLVRVPVRKRRPTVRKVMVYYPVIYPQHLGCILAKESPLPASWRCRLGRYCKVASLTDRVLAQV